MERLSFKDCISTWFGDSRTVIATSVGQVWALPQLEFDRAIRYDRLLRQCATYGDAQAVFDAAKSDSDAPRLIPRLIDFLHNDVDWLLETYFNARANDSDFKHDDPYSITVEEAWTWMANQPFTFPLNGPYDPNEGALDAGPYGDPHMWTDSWIPVEVAEAAGTRDTGWGMDYLQAEFIYEDLQRFTEAFSRFGIDVLVNNDEFLRMIGY